MYTHILYIYTYIYTLYMSLSYPFYLWEPVIYSACKFFVDYMFWNYVLSVYGWSFNFVYAILYPFKKKLRSSNVLIFPLTLFISYILRFFPPYQKDVLLSSKNTTFSNFSQRRQWHPTPVHFARKIPWTEEPGGLQSMGSLRVGHNWVTSLSLFTFMYWRRKWQPTPVFLPGESQGPGSLVGCHLWSHTELDMPEAT